MKELNSFHDDIEKRMGIFFGLGAFLLSSVFAMFQGLEPEGYLLRGVVVLILASLLGWGYGVWLKNTIKATTPDEEMPENMERRARNADTLEQGSVVMPSMGETIVGEEPHHTGQTVNFTLPELSPEDAPMQSPASLLAPIPAPVAAPAYSGEEEADLPPPAVPGWLK
jgi:hypothetical protein